MQNMQFSLKHPKILSWLHSNICHCHKVTRTMNKIKTLSALFLIETTYFPLLWISHHNFTAFIIVLINAHFCHIIWALQKQCFCNHIKNSMLKTNKSASKVNDNKSNTPVLHLFKGAPRMLMQLLYVLYFKIWSVGQLVKKENKKKSPIFCIGFDYQ